MARVCMHPTVSYCGNSIVFWVENLSHQEASALTLRRYLAYHLCFLKKSAIFLKKKSHLSKALGPGARPSLAKQWLVSQPRAHAPLPLHAATEPYSSSQQTASTYGWLCHTCFLPQCSAVGKGLLIKNQGSSSGIREADLNLAPLPVKLWCEGPGASGLPFQIDSIC